MPAFFCSYGITKIRWPVADARITWLANTFVHNLGKIKENYDNKISRVTSSTLDDRQTLLNSTMEWRDKYQAVSQEAVTRMCDMRNFYNSRAVHFIEFFIENKNELPEIFREYASEWENENIDYNSMECFAHSDEYIDNMVEPILKFRHFAQLLMKSEMDHAQAVRMEGHKYHIDMKILSDSFVKDISSAIADYQSRTKAEADEYEAKKEELRIEKEQNDKEISAIRRDIKIMGGIAMIPCLYAMFVTFYFL